MKTGLISLVVLMVASMASAAPILSYSAPVDLGGGRYGVTFGVSGGGVVGSWATNLTFTKSGTAIDQFKKNGTTTINTQAAADAAEGVGSPAYHAAMDSWVYGDTYDGSDYTINWGPLTSPYVNGTLLGTTGYTSRYTSWAIHVGTPGGVSYGDINLAYIVFEGKTGDQLGTWSGTVSRGGVDYVTSGSVMIPEPATMSLLALGGLSFLVRRRRTAK